MKNWKFILGILLVFLMGVVTGVVGVQLVTRHTMARVLGENGPDMINHMIMRRLSWELKLTEDQRLQIGQIVMDTQRELAQIREETRPRIIRALAQATRRIRALLTEEQAQIFDERVRAGREKLENLERNRRFDETTLVLPDDPSP